MITLKENPPACLPVGRHGRRAGADRLDRKIVA